MRQVRVTGTVDELIGLSAYMDADALRHLLGKRPIYGCRFRGTRYDAGDKLGFLKATVEFALKREDLGGPFREYLKSLTL